MNIGDKLVCKKMLYLGGNKSLIKDMIYEITSISKTIDGKALYRINNNFFTEINDFYNVHLYEYFISLAEYRNKRIDDILE